MSHATKTFLTDMLHAALKAVHPATCLPPALPSLPDGRVIVIGAGKASAAMAQVVEQTWAAKERMRGLVIAPYGSALPTTTIQVVEASHPVPDAAGLDGSRQILSLAETAGADDLVVVLLSGGGSALMPLPAGDIALAQKQMLTEKLLRSGTTIDEINCVRKHLSGIKGGQLAKAAYPARVLTLAISDVVGDDVSVIASGPTVPDPTTRYNAMGVLVKYEIEIPEEVVLHCQSPESETPKDSDICFINCETQVVATAMDALKDAAAFAKAQGHDALIVSDETQGDAADVGKHLAQYAVQKQADGFRGVLLSGGEVTVTQKDGDTNHGGPNRECLLSFAHTLNGAKGIAALFADTDGVDGKTLRDDPVAGAFVDDSTIARAQYKQLNPETHLAQHASEIFFDTLGDSVRTGPTQTNVNDFRAIWIGDR